MVKGCEKKSVRFLRRKVLFPKKWRKSFSFLEMGMTQEEAMQETQCCLGENM